MILPNGIGLLPFRPSFSFHLRVLTISVRTTTKTATANAEKAKQASSSHESHTIYSFYPIQYNAACTVPDDQRTVHPRPAFLPISAGRPRVPIVLYILYSAINDRERGSHCSQKPQLNAIPHSQSHQLVPLSPSSPCSTPPSRMSLSPSPPSISLFLITPALTIPSQTSSLRPSISAPSNASPSTSLSSSFPPASKSSSTLLRIRVPVSKLRTYFLSSSTSAAGKAYGSSSSSC